MNCTTARQYVQSEIDGELSTAQQADLAEHLRTCDACRAMRSQLRAIRSAMQRLAAASEPNDTSLPPIPFSSVRRVSWPGVPAWIWAAAAVIVLCFGSWLAKDMLHRSPVGPGPVVVNRDQPVEPPTVVQLPQPAQREAAEVTIQTPPDTIVVPYKSRNPRVAIFWLYKVTTTVRNPEPADRQTGRPM